MKALDWQHPERLRIPIEQIIAQYRKQGCRKFILLNRRNQLRKLISTLVGKERGRRFELARAPVELTQIDVPVDDFYWWGRTCPLTEHIQRIESGFSKLARLLAADDVLALEYGEHIEKSPVVAYERVTDWLGIDSFAAKILAVRTNPHPWREIVRNHQQVEQALKNTPYEWMLED